MTAKLSSIADSLTALNKTLATLAAANATSDTSSSKMALEIGAIKQAQVTDLSTSSGLKGWQHGTTLPSYNKLEYDGRPQESLKKFREQLIPFSR